MTDIDPSRVLVCGDRLLVKVHPPETVTAGGIVVPDTSQQDRCIATIIGLGLDVKSEQLRVGQEIVAGRYALRGSEMQELGKRFAILQEKDVLCVIQPEAKGKAHE